MTRLRPGGVFSLVSRDPEGRELGRAEFENGTTYQGVNHALDVTFRGAARFTTWYVGLVDNSGYAGVSSGDTHQSHPGWAEFNGLYGGNRGTWGPLAASGGFLDSVPLVLSVTASGSVRGALLASQQAIGTASGQVLYSTGAAAAPVPVVAGGTVTLTYKLRLTPRS